MIARNGTSLMTMRSEAGFSLIEIIIVVVIVGILATIALPAYQDSVRKGQRSDAKAGLLGVASRMEQFMLDRGTYTVDMEDLGYDDDPMVTTEAHYTIDAAACADGTIATCYVLTATPQTTSPQSGDAACTTFVLSRSGAKSATGSNADECWH